MTFELPDWLRGIVLLGQDGDEYRVVGVDEDGYLGAILKAAAAVTIADNVTVDQEDSERQMQGAEGENLRTIAVDAQGRIIMVPYGTTAVTQENSAREIQGANGGGLVTLAVDAEGRIIMVPYGTVTIDGAVTTSGTATVTQTDDKREIQGAEGENIRTIAVDAAGRMIMVPRGESGNYMLVSAGGYLSAKIRGREPGVADHDIAVDADGQMIMVPRGNAGNYLAVDVDGFMTTVMKGTYGAILKTLAADDEGHLVAILKDNADQWGKKISVGLAELAARLGSPISWERRGQVAKIQTFVAGLGDGVTSTSGSGASAELSPSYFQTGGYSYKLTTGTTVNRSAGVTIYGDFSPSDRIGFEFALSMDSQPDDIYLLGKVWDGTYEHRAYARIHKSTSKLQIQNNTPAYEDAANFFLPALASLFCSVKVVVDLTEQKWSRLLLRGTEYDLSAKTMHSPGVVVYPYFSLQILAVESAAVSHTIYLDRMIVTTNEP